MYLRTDYELKVLEGPLKAARAKPYTLEHLAGWLEKQPARESYNWDCSNGTCLISQYAKSVGDTANYSAACEKFLAVIGLAPGQAIATYAHIIALNRPWTYGAALTRAQAALERLS